MNQTDSVDVQKTAAVAIKAALKVGREWGLADAEISQLIGIGRPDVVETWREQLESNAPIQESLDDEATLRIGYLIGIYRSLHTLFPDPNRANRWVKQPNDGPGFHGRSALNRMLTGDAKELGAVCRYLKAQTH